MILILFASLTLVILFLFQQSTHYRDSVLTSTLAHQPFKGFIFENYMAINYVGHK